ncbi:MAG: hypothetical protein ACJ75F_13320 [Flavisolibacter sp.]|jgi:hypothetical protein
MDNRQKNNHENQHANQNANVLPPTEIVENPNPRANENIQRTEQNESDDQKTTGVGSEITDGEDA